MRAGGRYIVTDGKAKRVEGTKPAPPPRPAPAAPAAGPAKARKAGKKETE